MKIIKASRPDKDAYYGDLAVYHGVLHIYLEDVLVELDEDYELNYYDDDDSWASGSDDGNWYDGNTGNVVLSQSQVLNRVLGRLENEMSEEPGVYNINGEFTIPYTMKDNGLVEIVYSECEFYDLSVEEVY